MMEPFNARGRPNIGLLVGAGAWAGLLLGVAVFVTAYGTDAATLAWWWGIAGLFTFVFVMLALSFVMITRGARARARIR